MSYIAYNDKDQVAYLDRNTYDASRAVIFPRHLYGGEAVIDGYFVCSRPRDTELSYVYGVERDDHPDHFSHFNYGRCQYGYCTGQWPGRYDENEWCQHLALPKDMAPPRFYETEYRGPYNVSTQAMVDLEQFK